MTDISKEKVPGGSGFHNPGFNAEGTGGAGARAPKDNRQADISGAQPDRAAGAQRRDTSVSASPHTTPGQGDGAASSQTQVPPDNRVGSAQDGRDPNERSDMVGSHADPNSHGGGGAAGRKAS